MDIFSHLSKWDWFLFLFVVITIFIKIAMTRQYFRELVETISKMKEKKLDETCGITLPSKGQLATYMFFTNVDDILWFFFIFVFSFFQTDLANTNLVRVSWFLRHKEIFSIVNTVLIVMFFYSCWNQTDSFILKSRRYLENKQHHSLFIRILNAYPKQIIKILFFVAYLSIYRFSVESIFAILAVCFTVFDVVARNVIGWKKLKLFLEIKKSYSDSEELQKQIKDLKEEDIRDY